MLVTETMQFSLSKHAAVSPSSRSRATRSNNSARKMAMADSSNADRLAGRLFGPSEEGDNWWDSKCVFHPVVLRDQASGTWRMYYYGRNTDTWSRGATSARLSTGRVGLATSDDGLKWNRHRGPLPQGAILDPDDADDAFDSAHTGCSDVIFHEGEWWMFYFGGSATEPLRMRPGLAKSSDGVNWKRSLHNPLLEVGASGDWDELFAAWPRVIASSQLNPAWLMTYSAIENQRPPFSSIGLATSVDGHRWRKAGKVMTRGAPGAWDEGGVGRRHVTVVEREFVMVYEGVDANGVHGIGLARSGDGVRWERDGGGPVFSPRQGEDAWDNGTVAAPHLVTMADGNFRLYYVGSNASKSESAFGVAVSEGRNLKKWIRV